MAKKMTLVESIIKVGFDDKKAQQGLKKLKDQLKDKDKTERAAGRRADKRERKRMRQASKEHRQRKESQKRAKDSMKAREELEKRVLKYKRQKAQMDAKERREERKKIDEAVRERKRQKKYDRERARAAQRERQLTERANQRQRNEAQRIRSQRLSRAGGIARGAASTTRGVATATGAAGVVGGAAMSKKALDTTSTWEGSLIALYTQEAAKQKDGAQERADSIAKQIYQMGAAHYSDPNTLLKSFVEMRPLKKVDNPMTGDSYGITDEHILGMVSTMSKSAKATGTDAASFNRFMLGFRQFAANLGSQTASGQEIGQMRDASAQLYDMLITSMGHNAAMTPDEAAKLVQSGQLNLGQLMNAMSSLASKTEEGFQRYKNNSLLGKTDQMRFNIQHAERMFGEGARSGYIEFMSTLVDVLSNNEGLFKSAGVAVGGLLNRLAEYVEGAVNTWNSMDSAKQDEFLDNLALFAKIMAGLVGLSFVAPLFTFLAALTSLGALAPVAALLGGLGLLWKLLSGDGGEAGKEWSAVKEKKEAGIPLSKSEELSYIAGLGNQGGTYGLLEFFKDIGSGISSAFDGSESVSAITEPYVAERLTGGTTNSSVDNSSQSTVISVGNVQIEGQESINSWSNAVNSIPAFAPFN